MRGVRECISGLEGECVRVVSERGMRGEGERVCTSEKERVRGCVRMHVCVHAQLQTPHHAPYL